MENMSDQEFLTLVQSFTLSPATEETADVVQSMSEYIAQMKHREQIDATENEVLRSFPTDKMCDVGDTQIYNGISYRIDAVEVRDNLRNLDQNGYRDDVSEKLKNGVGVDENMQLQSYEREIIAFGNGYDKPLTYVEKTEHVIPKLVLVTMTIQNMSYEDEEDMLSGGKSADDISKKLLIIQSLTGGSLSVATGIFITGIICRYGFQTAKAEAGITVRK